MVSFDAMRHELALDIRFLGGSGFTLNWGCAMDVCDLVSATLK